MASLNRWMAVPMTRTSLHSCGVRCETAFQQEQWRTAFTVGRCSCTSPEFRQPLWRIDGCCIRCCTVASQNARKPLDGGLIFHNNIRKVGSFVIGRSAVQVRSSAPFSFFSNPQFAATPEFVTLRDNAQRTAEVDGVFAFGMTEYPRRDLQTQRQALESRPSRTVCRQSIPPNGAWLRCFHSPQP